MFLSSCLKMVRRHFRAGPAKNRPGERFLRTRSKPTLEAFEDRTIPSTFTVANLGDTGQGSGLVGDLRYAINTANSNADLSNRIVFQPGLTGTITLVQGKLVVGKALAIDGPGAELLTVSGNHQSGVFDIEAPAGQTVIFSDLTIADGIGSGDWEGRTVGGGLFNVAATVILNRATVSGNTVPSKGIGGGIFNNVQGSLLLNDSMVSDNHVGFDAFVAAIENLGTLTLHNSTVSRNTALGLSDLNIENIGSLTLDHSLITLNRGYMGSGLSTSQVVVNASVITNNTATYGAALSNNIGRATITDSTIANNFSLVGGGGLLNQRGQMTVSGSTIVGNTALNGGGIYTIEGNLQVTNSTISGNTAQEQGGGLWAGYNGSGVVELTSVTITRNSSLSVLQGDGGGGGVYLESVGAFLIRNSIVAANTAALDGPDFDGAALSLGHNLIGQTDGSSGWLASDRTGTSSRPLEARLGPLQDNGGPTMTHALLTGSPALGGGDPSLTGSTDQRGSVRQFQHPIDIGAFQTEQATQFRLRAPTVVSPGEPFNVTVMALDQWGNTASTYAGAVRFSSTDLFAQLPDDTAFSGDDAGVHTFSVTLQTPGAQGLGVVDTRSSFIRGSATVDVTDGSSSSGSSSVFWALLAWETDASGVHSRQV